MQIGALPLHFDINDTVQHAIDLFHNHWELEHNKTRHRK
jgi:hypothetical protein